MVTAFSVFINGISIAVLYLMMKLLAIVADRSTADSTPSAPKPTTR